MNQYYKIEEVVLVQIQYFFEKKKREKKESHSFRNGGFKGKVFEQNTTRMGGDFVRNPKGLTLT
ncbi:hypothetical protein OBJ92_06430 [Empedobacter falsenii]